MKKILFFTILMLPFVVTAQGLLKGEVYDFQTKSPLQGAVVSGADQSKVITDQDGKFQMPCTDEVIISFVGYDTEVIVVDNCNEFLHVSLRRGKENLREVEIIETRDSDRPQLYEPKAIAHLSVSEINRGTGLYLDDAINRNAPGVTMSRRGISSGQQFNIRGFGNGVGFKGANNNFDTRGTKVYLNGIPLTTADGTTVLDDIDFGSIGEVSVIKGPANTLYGFAIAGVVNLRTIRPEPNQTSIGQKILIGDYGLRRFTTTLQTATDKSALLINYGRQESDGYQPHTASRKDFVNFIGEFRPSANRKLTTYFGYGNSYDERAGELTIEEYDDFDYSGNSRYIKNNAHSEVIGFRAGLSHKYIFGEHLSNQTTIFGSGREMNSSSAGGWSDDLPVNYGFRSSFNFRYPLKGDFSLDGIVGAEVQAQKSHPISYGMVADSSDLEGYNIIGDIRSNQVADSKSFSWFTEWTLGLPADISLTAGVGVSTMSIHLEDRTYDPSSTEQRVFETDYVNLVSPHVAVNKVFNQHFSVYADYSKGYRPPVSSNIVIGHTGELNTGLIPEEGDQIEIGSKGDFMDGKLTYKLALFRTKFTNKFTSVAVPLDSVTTAYSYLTNAGGQIDKGLEVLANYLIFESSTSFLSAVNVWANFTYSDFNYDDFYYESVSRSDQSITSKEYDGNAVAGVAPVTANAGVDFSTKPGIFGNVNYNYRDAMPITSDGDLMTEAFSLVNAKLGYRRVFFDRWDLEIFAGANNITGSQHYIMVFINQLPDAYIPAPHEINYYGGINLRYNF